MSDRLRMDDHERKIVVVKIGSSSLVGPSHHLDRKYLQLVADQIAAVRAAGWSPIIVTSAAIACGLDALHIKTRPSDMPSLQAAASVGQNMLAMTYAEVFAAHHIVTSLVLLTRRDTASRHAYLHARDTLCRLIDLDVVPIVNENDTTSVDEIRFGDNDTLSALVACLVKADLDIILSDIAGLYDADPHDHADAHLLQRVDAITEQIMASAGGVGSSVGSGGMITKIRAARVLMTAGIPLVVCDGHESHVIERIIDGESVGTRFCAKSHHHEITPYKLWIALGDSPKGSVSVDDGAKQALIERGSSLLCVGAIASRGEFAAGDIIDVKDRHGHLFARGKVNASSDGVRLALGCSQDQLAGNHLLAPMARHPLIHRDELVVFE